MINEVERIQTLKKDIVSSNGTMLGEIRGDINSNLTSFNIQCNIYNTDSIENSKDIINESVNAFYTAFSQGLFSNNWDFVQLPDTFGRDIATTLPFDGEIIK
ncbi:MAG: hypothetical protein RSC24_06605 [Clostridium sp.]